MIFCKNPKQTHQMPKVIFLIQKVEPKVIFFPSKSRFFFIETLKHVSNSYFYNNFFVFFLFF